MVGVPSQSILEHRTEGPKWKWDHCQKEKKEKKKGKWKISTSSMSLWLHCSLALQLHVGLARLGLSLAGLLISIWNLHIILQSSTLRLEIVKYLYLLLNKILRAFTYHVQSFLFLVLGWLTFSTYRLNYHVKFDLSGCFSILPAADLVPGDIVEVSGMLSLLIKSTGNCIRFHTHPFFILH